MDIDYNSIVVSQVMKNTSFLIPKAKLTSQNVGNENGAYINSTMKQRAQNDSAIPMFQVDDMYINSQDEMQPFPYIQKPMPSQSNTFKSTNESNPRDPGDLFQHPDASQDEPTISRRRKASNTIESSDNENDEMYAMHLIIGMFLLRHW